MVSAVPPAAEPLWSRTVGAAVIGVPVALVCGFSMLFVMYALPLTGPGAAVLGPAADIPKEMDRPFLFELGAAAAVLVGLLCAAAFAIFTLALRLPARRSVAIMLAELAVATILISSL